MDDFLMAIRKILEEIGENPERQGLVDTPKRMERMPSPPTKTPWITPFEMAS